MKEQPVRIYAKKRLGAFPELDQHIIYDETATQRKFRYLVCGEAFHTKLVDARECVKERLKIEHANPATEVHYTPATGWTFGPRTTTQGEGSPMNAVVDSKATTATPAVTPRVKPGPRPGSRMQVAATEVPTGKWLEAVQKLADWEAKNPKPADDAEEGIKKQWKLERQRLNGNVTYNRQQVQKKNAPAEKPAATPVTAQKATPVLASVQLDLKASIVFNGVKMECDSIKGIESALAMIKATIK